MAPFHRATAHPDERHASCIACAKPDRACKQVQHAPPRSCSSGTARSTGAGTPLCYDAHAYPYWFVDTDGSGGVCSSSEASYSNSFSAWTPALMKATFNDQMAQNDPGAWAHNFAYMSQLLIDGIEDLGGDVSGLNRP